MNSEKNYYVLVNFMAKQVGWLTVLAESEDNAREKLIKEFTDTKGIKDFEITEVRDVPPIMDVPVPHDTEDVPSEDTDIVKETVH